MLKFFSFLFIIQLSFSVFSQNEFDLLDAAYKNEEKKVYYLLKGGIDPNVHDGYGVTPLMYTVDNNNLYLVKLLLSYGADVNIIPDNKNTALISAVKNNNPEIVELLLKNNADPNICDKKGNSPVMLCAAYGYPLSAAYLCNYGADIFYQNTEGTDAAMIAAYYNDTDILQVLWDYFGDFNNSDINGFTPLLIASQQGNSDAVIFLIKNDADIYAHNSENLNCLDLALLNKHIKLAEYLIKNYPSLSHKINTEISTFNIAEYYNLADILPYFHKNGKKIKKHHLYKKNFNFAEKNIPVEIF